MICFLARCFSCFPVDQARKAWKAPCSFPDVHDAGNEGYHDQRAEFLRPLSATCKAMRLRLLPWVWERVEVHQKPRGTSEKQVMRGLNVIAECLAADTFLATSVKYISALLFPESGADSLLLMKIHKDTSPRARAHYFFARQMPTVPPKPPHTRDRVDGWQYYDRTQERSCDCRIPQY